MSDDRYNETFGRDPWGATEPARRGPQAASGAPRVRKWHRDVFVIYRPLHTCPFCSRKIHAERDTEGNFLGEAMPDPGDTEYLCPHVRRTEYQQVLDKLAAESVFVGESTVTTLANGVVQVVVTWGDLLEGPKPMAGGPADPPRF